ncbi:MAG TPA: hypothetical protein VFV50_15985, partial [Bdellovibrionales bacterium]|nr:hypothetical protein [Bdellovibrionales bacterium]
MKSDTESRMLQNVFDQFRSYWRGNIAEIENDKTLIYYGAALGFCHIVCALWWLGYRFHTNTPWAMGEYAVMLWDQSGVAICWPFYQNCQDYRFASLTAIFVIFWGYLAFSIVSTLVFFKKG